MMIKLKKMSSIQIGYKANNPIFQILLKHLSIEAEIFKVKNDIYSLSWILFALMETNKEKKSIVKFIISSLEAESKKIIEGDFDLTTELLIKFALGERILKFKDKKNHKITKAMKILLEESKNKKWLNSQETTSMLLFLLSKDDRFNSELNAAYKWLYSKYNQFIDAKNYANVIDSSLGLISHKNEQIKFPFKEVIRELKHQSIERISKFLIYLIYSGKKEYLTDTISLLEHKINDKFEKWIFPNLEMALFEGISLANSNLSKNDIKTILMNLQKDNEEWAKSISISDNGLTLTDIKEIKRIPAFNVKEDALSLLALSASERERDSLSA